MSGAIIYGRAAVPLDGYGDRRVRRYQAYHGRGYRSYGDLSQDDLTLCQQALSQLCAAAQQSTAATSPTLSTILGSSLLGASSTAQAAQSNAIAQQNLCDVMSTKLAAWQADPTQASHQDAVDFVQTCSQSTGNADILSTIQGLQVGTIVSTVASQTASQVASGVKAAASAAGGFAWSAIPWWVWLGGAAALATYLGWKPLKRSST